MKYRFARAWARVTIGVGFIVLILGCLFALLPFAMETGWAPDAFISLDPPMRALARIVWSVVALGLGLLIGGSMIVVGQLILIQSDQRQLLARQCRQLRRLLRVAGEQR